MPRRAKGGSSDGRGPARPGVRRISPFPRTQLRRILLPSYTKLLASTLGSARPNLFFQSSLVRREQEFSVGEFGFSPAEETALELDNVQDIRPVKDLTSSGWIHDRLALQFKIRSMFQTQKNSKFRAIINDVV